MVASTLGVEGALPKVLVVEDDRIVALDLAGALEELGYDVVGSTTRGEDAIEMSLRMRPNLVLMDVRLAGKIDGIQAAQAIRGYSDVPVIYLTAHSDRETLQRAACTVASGYLVKPFKATELRCCIEIALHKHAVDVRLRENEQWLATTLHSIADAVIATDQAGHVKLFNRIAEKLTGWPCDQARQRAVEDVLAVVQESDGAPIPNLVRAALERREPIATSEPCELRAKSGERIAVEESAAPIIDAYGNVLGGVLVLRDIRERRQQLLRIQQLNEELEQRVRERTAELEALNLELESFSYSVAHDLRAPLRSIDGFSQLLLEEYQDRLDATGIGYVERVRRSASRMAELIEALLSLARVGRTEMKVVDVDLARLSELHVNELRAARAPRDVTVIIQPELHVRGDPSMLRLAIGNLLDNAWKFTSRRVDPRIEVGALREQNPPVFFVRDNGAGFNPAHADKLFAAFQRLHNEAEFPGTGIGLAIVQRVVARHGGTIRAESQPAAGATFYFTLPNAD